MIEVLQNLIPEVLKSLKQPSGDFLWLWDSLIVNRRKPYTYRVFKNFGNYRVCLHAFDPCESEESFAHPHPWPGAFLMLKGSYIHTVGFSADLESDPTFLYREIVRPYSTYEITHQQTWHQVQPLERTYTIMVNGSPWENPHKKVKTTKGKDLDKMSPEDLAVHQEEFFKLLTQYKETING